MADGPCGSAIDQSPMRCPVCRVPFGYHAPDCRAHQVSDEAAERIALQHREFALKGAVAEEHY